MCLTPRPNLNPVHPPHPATTTTIITMPTPPTTKAPTVSTSTSTSASATPSPKPSLRTEWRGRQSLLLTWLTTSPFVTSFIEDIHKGTARHTRSNTLSNRLNLHPRNFPSPNQNHRQPQPKQQQQQQQHSKKRTRYPSSASMASTQTSSASDATTTTTALDNEAGRPAVSFAQVAKVYSSHGQTEVRVKKETKALPLEIRRKRAALNMLHNPHLPTSAAGKWLIRKTSTADDIPPDL